MPAARGEFFRAGNAGRTSRRLPPWCRGLGGLLPWQQQARSGWCAGAARWNSWVNIVNRLCCDVLHNFFGYCGIFKGWKINLLILGGGVESKAKKGEFYLMMSDVSGSDGHGVVMDDLLDLPPALRLAIPGRPAGISEIKSRPKIRYDSNKGILPRDLESGFKGYWLISEDLKALLESLDSDAFEFLQCEYVVEGSRSSESRYLCDIIRIIDSIDEDGSKMKVEFYEPFKDVPGGKTYSVVGGASLAFKKEKVGSSKIFRDEHAVGVYCTREFRDQLVLNGFGVGGGSRGVVFIDAADI